MRINIKLISLFLILIIVMSSVFCYGVSADTANPPTILYYGDVDMDGSVTVRDATLIQKGIAGLTYLNGAQVFLADPNGSGISVKNATAIQCSLAHRYYEQNRYIGTEVKMASPDEFSYGKSVDDEFESDMIVVRVKTSVKHKYTLADFPEFEFKSISCTGEALGLHYLFLELTYPSKENVIDALKALDFRASLDLESVHPNYIYSIE